MALIGNYSVLLKTPGRLRGGQEGSARSNFGNSGSLKNYIYRSEVATVDKMQAFQPGAVGPHTNMLPQVAGAMVSHFKVDGVGSLTGSGALGRNADASLTGDGAITSALLALVVSAVASLSGSGSLTLSLVGKLEAAAALAGSGDLTGAAGALASILAELSGTGTASAVPYATGSLEANIRGYGDLTPEGIRDAVWRAIASQFNDAGTMGNLLNSAGSGGVDYGVLVNAIMTAIVDGSTTFEESIRLQNAVLAGKVSGAGTGTETFRDLADTKDRIVATVDSSGNRTAVIRDAS